MKKQKGETDWFIIFFKQVLKIIAEITPRLQSRLPRLSSEVRAYMYAYMYTQNGATGQQKHEQCQRATP
jgi:hypothetical protein